MMRNKILYGAISGLAVFCLALWASGGALSEPQGTTAAANEDTASSDVGRNIKILTKITTKADLLAYMKNLKEWLGTTCKSCHVLTDFARDEKTLNKETAREMMRMVASINERLQSINKKLFPDGSRNIREEVTCFTCHRGHEKPPINLQEWEQAQQKEEI
ncbi:MAG: c-type cytochrome [Candidatus Omnitrophota bacterium]